MPGIMIQGTASSAGKSTIATALCRIFSDDGYSVCPFKAQNMSLNSYVTKEGLEMGVGQMLQAQAARIDPSAYMNPILLKPTADRIVEVLIEGKPYGKLEAANFNRLKPQLREMLREVYIRLASSYDIMVLEGAGSPAEINLNDDDIANMGMAEIADCPVILVADIDKGGVFASIYGTIMLLKEHERNRIKGIIINKFRGEKASLQSGIDKIEKLVNIPVLGVVPYIDIHLDEEDGACVSKIVGKDNINTNGIEINEKREEEINRLASVVRENLDIKYIYRILGVE